MKISRQQNALISTMFVGLLVLLISSSLGFSQTKSQQLDALLNQYLEYDKFNGSVLIAEQGKVVYKKGFGMANMEWDIPNAPDTKHRLGSVTKQFTGMLILQLAAEGKLDLHAPISKYLPDYPNDKADKITTHHLLVHSSGIPSYTSFPGFFKDMSILSFKPDEFLKEFQGMDLEFEPGESFSYSNSGYFVLGVIIEKITGKTYEQALQDKIFAPLKMNDSGYDHHNTVLKKRATGYEKDGAHFINSHYLDMSIPYAAGSLYSTAEDLYKWDQALYTNQLLPKKYMDLYFKPHIAAFGDLHYAYGWMVGYDFIGNTSDSIATISHGGGINGFNTLITRSIADKSLIVLLNNTGGAPLNQMAKAIRGIMNGKTYDLPKRSLVSAFEIKMEAEGMESALAFFEANKNGDDMELNEYEMNALGYQLMGNDKVEDAAQVFKLNMETFPKSFNVYDSYAEALMNLGDKEGAIKNYKISIEMNPGNQNGMDKLKELGEDTSSLVEEVIVADEILASYIGDYELMPGFILTISKEEKQLKAKATGQPAFDIFPKSDYEFFVKMFEAQITFNANENGQVEGLTLLQGGQELSGKKVKQ